MKETCPECGGVLSAGELGGQCPSCLMQLAMDCDTERSELDAPTMAFERSSARIDKTVAHRDEATAGCGDDSNQRRVALPSLPGYEMVREVARGGMGIVFEAKHLSLNRTVAVKMLLAGEYAASDQVDRFKAEAQAAAKLDHPSIVPIFDVGEYEGRRFFSMAFVRGEGLDRILAQGPMEPRRAARMALKLANALKYAHCEGVVHRDLKPGNILIDENDEPRITDFGLAKRLDADQQLTATGQTLGTPSYMAPEQASGKSAAIGPAADIYSLGGVLYAMLTGRPPFLGDTSLSTILQVLEREPEPPSHFCAAIDEDLETICLKCLEKQPLQRYLDADALARDLQNYLADQPIEARTIRGWAVIKKWYRTVQRNKDVRIQSKSRIGNWPWVAIAFGRDVDRDEDWGHARGILAFGDQATGVFAYGGKARGVIAFGRSATGLIAFGAIAKGVLACGMVSLGIVAWGGIAIGGYAFGAIAIGYHASGLVVVGWRALGAYGRQLGPR